MNTSGMQCLYGTSDSTLLQRSLMTRIERSTSPTCSLAAVVLTGTSVDRSSRGLNSMSIRHIFTRNPPLRYSLATASKLAWSCLAIRLGRNSTVISLMPLDRVTKNGKPFTNITSAVRTTSLSRSYICCGIDINSGLNRWGRFLTVFPLIAPLSGPNKARPLVKSAGVKGTLATLLVLTRCFTFSSGGCAIMASASRAPFALVHCSSVRPFIFSRTVSMHATDSMGSTRETCCLGLSMSIYDIPPVIPVSRLNVRSTPSGDRA